ncbi:cellulose-growth-specific protein [Plectosphaerella plurivora]|uniref:lytic cellulose monooxygenase (C4-dehydrogenating) n=1 Tax=Plectosphaerella plurivora TaxID=936078 RepID=A0A9P8VJF9_9PEZI|nr:cellulose-growth-specific protein [Plectosphaerella plurivora]
MKYILPTVVASAALAAAHGFVDSAVIGGENYEFYQPYTDPYTTPAPDRVSRFIAGNGPVLDVTSNDMTCGGFGEGSKPAALHAAAAAGSTVQLTWTLWPDSHVGPVLTYMARCPDAGCQDYQPGTDAVWFKIQEGGREGVTNNWAASKLMTAGGVAEYTIPECIEPGFYLVRHEIIALHQGAEYYPGCHQLEVTGSGSTVPTGLVSFPGAYSKTDAGIDYSPYQQTEEYTIPGPALFTCGGSAPAPAPAPTTAAATVAPTAAATSAAVSSAAATAAPAPSSAPAPVDPVEDDEEPVEDDCPVDDEEPVEEEPVEEEEDCPAEDDEEEGGLDPVAVDDEDDCPAEDDEEPIEEPVEDEDDCPAEDDEEPIEEEPVDEDDCPAEDDEEPIEEPVNDDDEYEDIDDCEEAVVPTKRQTIHERRFNY